MFFHQYFRATREDVLWKESAEACRSSVLPMRSSNRSPLSRTLLILSLRITLTSLTWPCTWSSLADEPVELGWIFGSDISCGVSRGRWMEMELMFDARAINGEVQQCSLQHISLSWSGQQHAPSVSWNSHFLLWLTVINLVLLLVFVTSVVALFSLKIQLKPHLSCNSAWLIIVERCLSDPCMKTSRDT